MALDIAQQTELALLERQKPMNAVIDRGDSDVQQFYRDAVVLLTGGSGFLGKQFVEKLFRAPGFSFGLTEVGKLFERVIADRLVAHLVRVGPDLADGHFGFRRGRSTVDAIMSVRAFTMRDAVSQGRSCDIKKMYLLLRPKKGKTIQQRLAYILKDPLYDTLRKKKPNFAGRIVPVDGDVAGLRLSLADKDWDIITKEVNIIVHMAATVNFQAPLHIAGIINVRGTRELLELGKQCHNLKLFTHVSTAFTHATVPRIDSDVKEQFYPCPVAPDVFLDMIASIDKERLTSITPALIKDWPNTYTFTKAIAEELVRTSAGDLPVCVVKPPVVGCSFVEPSPGWIDSQTIMSSAFGLILGAGMGVIHVFNKEKDVAVSFAPVDYVNNAIIAAGWDSVQNRQLWGGDIPIYTVGNSRSGIKFGAFAGLLQTDEFNRLSTPKAVWYMYCIETNNRVLYWLLAWFLHYIPGYFLDTVVSMLGIRPKGVPPLVKIYSRVDNMLNVYRFFMSNNWNIRDDNLQSMISRLSPADKAIYTCDVGQLILKDFVKASCVGIRRFIIKDGLVGSDVGYRKQQWLFYANIVFLSLYVYCLWKLVAPLCSGVAVLFSV